MNALSIINHYVQLIDSEQEVFVLATKSIESEILKEYVQSKNTDAKVSIYGVYNTGILCYINGKKSKVRVSKRSII